MTRFLLVIAALVAAGGIAVTVVANPTTGPLAVLLVVAIVYVVWLCWAAEARQARRNRQ